MKIVLYAMGTLGDVLPVAEIGKKLKNNGVNVVVITNRYFEKVINDYGLEVHIVTETDLYAYTYSNPKTWTLEGVTDHYIDYHVPAIKPSFDFVKSLVEKGEEICVISQSRMSGADMACEAFGLKSAHIALAPWSVHSDLSPSYPLCAKVKEADKEEYMPIISDKIIGALHRDIVRKHMNPIREELGLEPWVPSTIPRLEDSESITALFPEWFRTVPDDWPKHIFFAGFVQPSQNNKSSIAFFKDFVQMAGKPILFTGGTGVWSNDEEVKKCKIICEKLGVPGVYVNLNMPDLVEHTDENFLCVNFLDFTSALEYCRLFVSHGGIGTVAEGITAGVPQLIKPMSFDQPDNAYWLWNLGVGNAVAQGSTVDEFVDMARELIESKKVAKKLATYKKKVKEERYLDEALAKILYHFNDTENRVKIAS